MADSTMRGRTLWTRKMAVPLRDFLRTESGSAGVLVAAIAIALVWANVDPHSYETVLRTHLSVRLGGAGISLDLHDWINSGLMTIFFLVVGLEARREFDLGDLRERRRFILPATAGVVGMAIPALTFLAVNAGGPGAHGWGVTMSTDTALALGLLALLGKGVPDQVRVFLLTVFVVDDLVALVIIAVFYSTSIAMMPLILAVVLFAVMLTMNLVLKISRGVWFVPFGVALWAALLASGVDPVVSGLAIGLTVAAYSPSRTSLEEASGLFRLFREQPTPEMARSASLGLVQTLSPNDRLQRIYHPWSSYLIVPLFGLANAGIEINGPFLARAFTSPVTWGIIVGYVVGKPVAVVGVSWLLATVTRGSIRPTVGWAGVLGAGTIAGIGFTVSLLIANLAFTGDVLAEAKVGVLSAAVVASALTYTVFRVTQALPKAARARLLLGDSEQLLDLDPPVDPARDHVRGPATASVTVVEYGDFQCPYCGQAEPVVRELLGDTDLRFVWRNLPLSDVHPQARMAAQAAEAAAAQGKFWEMHDVLLDHQDALRIVDLLRYAEQIGLDAERFHGDVMAHLNDERIDDDLDSADRSGVSGTPTFFINGQRHYGAYDIATLTEAVRTARARTWVGRPAAKSQ